MTDVVIVHMIVWYWL